MSLSRAGGRGVRLAYSGVPAPAPRFVSLFRVLYAEQHANAVADSARSVYADAKELGDAGVISVGDLDKDTEYQVWMEAYLRNGRVAKSNVIEVRTTNDDNDEFGSGEFKLSGEEL